MTERKVSIFRFERLNIDEISVENSDNKIELLEWKSEVERGLASVSNRIDTLKNGVFTPESKEELIKAKSYKRRLGMFHQKIALRLSQLKIETKKTQSVISIEDYEKRAKVKEESRTSFPWFFLEVSKELLSMKQFTEIEIEAYIRKNKAYEERQKNNQNNEN